MKNGKVFGISPDNIRLCDSFEASEGDIFRDSNLFNHDSEFRFAALNESDLDDIPNIHKKKIEIKIKISNIRTKLDNNELQYTSIEVEAET